jgi:hypothetical protein
VKLAAKLNVPLEHLMHMPQHILVRKLMELAQEEQSSQKTDASNEKTEQ